jgi:hypothetical protein
MVFEVTCDTGDTVYCDSVFTWSGLNVPSRSLEANGSHNYCPNWCIQSGIDQAESGSWRFNSWYRDLFASVGATHFSITTFDYPHGGNPTDAFCLPIDYGPHPPAVADFSGLPLSGEAPLTVQFTDLSYPPATFWDWEFSDGGFALDKNPVHTFVDPGVYSVYLFVRTPWGMPDISKADYIEVLNPSLKFSPIWQMPIGRL